MKKILITGGAGFIGSHLAEELYSRGHSVIILDNLSPQVHGKERKSPRYLVDKVEFIVGDVRNRKLLKKIMCRVDAIVHLAAETGVGQSMYEIARYVDTNVNGTATILDILVNTRHDLEKLVVASSRAVYGEGKYNCNNCGIVYPNARRESQLSKKEWEPRCPVCEAVIHPLPTDESSALKPTSIYAITKQAQEGLTLLTGRSYGIPTTVLRYYNVYGPRQSLLNPYTGILSVFSSRIVSDRSLMIFEDGEETRDFVYVSDAVRATILALEKSQADYEIFNVGTGQRVSVLGIAKTLLREFGSSLPIKITGKYRIGDVRHCYADLSKIKEKLGYAPIFSLRKGIPSFVKWVRSQGQHPDSSEKAQKELIRKGLFR